MMLKAPNKAALTPSRAGQPEHHHESATKTHGEERRGKGHTNKGWFLSASSVAPAFESQVKVGNNHENYTTSRFRRFQYIQ